MRLFQAPTKDGTLISYPAYTIEEFPISEITTDTFTKGKGEHSRIYSNAIATFDIETTSYRTPSTVSGFMYIWQFCIDGICIYGRTWKEFADLLQLLHNYVSSTLIIYVHNLSFEFQFIRQLLLHQYETLEVFAPQKRKPLTVRTEHLEFRCSYRLSNMTLEKACLNELNCKYIKASGDLDYTIYRDASTPLTDKEFSYALTDVLCLYSYIRAKLGNDGDTLKSIPLTSTGYVRRDCRKSCLYSPTYKNLYSRLTLTTSIYTLLKEAGRGGDTSSNRFLTGQMIAEVDSFDATSSYPYQLLTQKFPMSRFYPYGTVPDMDTFEQLCSSYCVLFRATFEGLHAKPEAVDLYLSVDKANSYTRITNCNGRIYTADCINYTLTEIDWEIVKSTYDFSSISITDVHYAKKEYLPNEICDVIRSYFTDKCNIAYEISKLESLGQNDDNLSYLYAKSKNKLNSIFGMMYTDIIRNDITIDEEGTWHEEAPDITTAINDHSHNRNNFLYYPWGVWTTAHGRNHLHTLITIIGESSIYWDTDSNKAQITPSILSKISEVNASIKALCDERHAYVDMPYGREYLGIFKHETSSGSYRRFKTLGSKKYAYEDHNGKLHVTISGVNKKLGPVELSTLDNFSPGFLFQRAGGKALHYNSAPFSWSTGGDNIGMEDSTYLLGVTREFAEILGFNVYTKNGELLSIND